MGDVCCVFDFLIVLGNVSFYNESKVIGGGLVILLILVIGGVGLM